MDVSEDGEDVRRVLFTCHVHGNWVEALKSSEESRLG